MATTNKIKKVKYMKKLLVYRSHGTDEKSWSTKKNSFSKKKKRSIEILKLPFVLSAIFIEIFSFIHGIACSRRIEIIQNAFVSHGEHEKFRIAHIENWNTFAMLGKSFQVGIFHIRKY